MLRPEGPSTYGNADVQAASELADKIVAHYGMTLQGLLLYVPPLTTHARAEAGVRCVAACSLLMHQLPCRCALCKQAVSLSPASLCT